MAKGESLGACLKRLREKAGLSQPGLAQATGIPTASIRNWEQDNRVPGLVAAYKVARAIGVSLEELAAVAEETEQAEGRSKPTRKGVGR